MKDNDVFMTDWYEKWEKVQDKAFTMVMNAFVKWLGTQDQLKYADDILDELSYTYMGFKDKDDDLVDAFSWNKMDVGIKISRFKAILWKGVLMKEDQDAQVNIEIQPFESGDDYCRIFTHKKGLPLTEGWYDETKF